MSASVHLSVSALIKIVLRERRIPFSIRSIRNHVKIPVTQMPVRSKFLPRKTRVSVVFFSQNKQIGSKSRNEVTNVPTLVEETSLRITTKDLDLPRPVSSSHLCGLPANFFTPPSWSPLMVRGSLHTVRAIMTPTSYSRAGVGVLLLDSVADFFASIHNRAASSAVNAATTTVTQSKMSNLC